MAEYIKKQDALEIIKSYWHESYDTVSAYILDVPAADIHPVVHGKWIMKDKGTGVCSNCNRQDHIDPLSTHCRYCGAKMDFGGSD